jgi:hypothetical protein
MRGRTQATCVVEVGVSLPRKTSGKVILVMSGRGRMMYQCLQPEPEGAILPKRSAPQEVTSSPHDAGASMANWLETNIQGGEVALTPVVIGRTSRSFPHSKPDVRLSPHPAFQVTTTLLRGSRPDILVSQGRTRRPCCMAPDRSAFPVGSVGPCLEATAGTPFAIHSVTS